jgi:hypothetical protein
MMSGARRALLAVAIVGLAASTSGCREDEQGRPMTKQKGVYEGQADEKLDEGQLSDLRSRSAGQRF